MGANATVWGYYAPGSMPPGDGLVMKDTGLIIPYVLPGLESVDLLPPR